MSVLCSTVHSYFEDWNKKKLLKTLVIECIGSGHTKTPWHVAVRDRPLSHITGDICELHSSAGSYAPNIIMLLLLKPTQSRIIYLISAVQVL